MSAPSAYRNIFLFVSGRTPQIITETLFFFVARHHPVIRPHEIHVLTTTEGHELISGQLLATRTGRFYRFCQEYHLDPQTIRFSAETIEVLHDAEGLPLADIRTGIDNRVAADQILVKVRTLTNSPQTRLFASMAGGRKTMGLYLALAMQFYGRPQDRLTHVLISPSTLENNPRFFYPPARKNGLGHTATITVAEVPFLLLNHKIPVLRDRSDLSYAALVTQSQREIDLLNAPLPLTVDRVGRRLHIGGAVIPLSGLEFALYLWVARKRQQAECASTCNGCATCTVGAADFLDPQTITALEHIAAEVGVRDPRLQELHWWSEGEEGKKRFLQVCARIKNKVHKALGNACGPYTVAPLPTRPQRVARYTITVSKPLVRFA